MIIFRDFKELFEIILQWEDTLTDYYTVGEKIIQNEKCKEIITFLKEKHLSNLQFIKDIHIEDYGKDGWIRCAPECCITVILPVREITSESTQEEIINHISEFEETMMKLYVSISEEITSHNEKELFDSLVKFKGRQIYEIKSCLDM